MKQDVFTRMRSIVTKIDKTTAELGPAECQYVANMLNQKSRELCLRAIPRERLDDANPPEDEP